ncbi:MAG TPA: Mpo1-like protein [Oleiagrimonas sp.]|nr:Mpo1-like protein [Oleiagrimonas sp.]
MRSIHDWFESYANDHRHPTNRAIHWVCVPVILWCVIALLWLIPVPTTLMHQGAWSVLAMFATYLFYHRLSRSMGWAMALVFVAMGLITHGLYGVLGFHGLLWLAVALFVLAWIGQFVGHVIEGQRPSFLTDLAYLLIGPAWLTGKVMKRIGLSY